MMQFRRVDSGTLRLQFKNGSWKKEMDLSFTGSKKGVLDAYGKAPYNKSFISDLVAYVRFEMYTDRSNPNIIYMIFNTSKGICKFGVRLSTSDLQKLQEVFGHISVSFVKE